VFQTLAQIAGECDAAMPGAGGTDPDPRGLIGRLLSRWARRARA
jgi:hypothetical protein